MRLEWTLQLGAWDLHLTRFTYGITPDQPDWRSSSFAAFALAFISMFVIGGSERDTTTQLTPHSIGRQREIFTYLAPFDRRLIALAFCFK